MIPGTSSISRPGRLGAANGGGQLWTPAYIAPALDCWWDADPDTYEIDANGKVSTWRSKLPGGSNSIPAGKNQTATPTTVNGSSALALTSPLNTTGLAFPEIYAASGSLPTSSTLLFAGVFGNGNIASWGSSALVELFGGDRFNQTYGNTAAFSTAVACSGPISGGIMFNNDAAGGRPCFLFDIMGKAGNGYVNSGIVGPTKAGNGIIGTAGQTFLGLAVANRGLQLADMARWEGYYAHRMGATGSLAADHPYKTEPPRV